ncbi:carboxylesterase family protein [Emticicia agri]|uniref:Peptidase n=1 Tax=Emticicia agri TaxID=2492393 RepID=A0A4Q5M3J0_9BACT|nr:peptidase [Emticicia agri]RYU96914.1 peptidase [Emticicia agri]
MTRSFYSSAIVFAAIYTVLILFKSILYLILGIQASNLPSIGGWFTFEFLTWLVWSIILLKYYHFYKHTFVFRALILSIVVSVFHFFSFLQLMQTKEILNYHIITIIGSLGAGILYAISLLSSGTGKNRWLRMAGIVLLIEGIIMTSAIIWSINSTSFMLSGTLGRIEQWVGLAGTLVPIAFIFHFLEEKKISTDKPNAGQESWVGTINFAAVIIAMGGLYFISILVLDSMDISKNARRADTHLKKIAEPFEAGIYVNNHQDTLRYRLLKPLNYDSTRQYPLVICLHGSSGSGMDNARQVVASLPVPLLSKPENRTKYPAFLFVPQCPVGATWGGIPHFPAIDSLVFEAIASLQQKLPFDTNRYYVAGNSLGGYGAWHFISTRPTLFAAAIPISGAGNTSVAKNIVDIPVWAFHGANDRNVPVIGSRVMIEAMKKAGGNPRYTEYSDKAHNIWNEVSDTPGLLQWLFAQRKK